MSHWTGVKHLHHEGIQIIAGNGNGSRNRHGNDSNIGLVLVNLSFITVYIGLMVVIHSWYADLGQRIDKINETLVTITIAFNQRQDAQIQRQDESIARSDAWFDAQIQRQDESIARSEARFYAKMRRQDESIARSDARFYALLREVAAERRELFRALENRRIETDQRLDEHEEHLQQLERELDQDNR